ILPHADVYIFAVKDDVLSHISLPFSLVNSAVIHCSGTSALDILQDKSPHLGVIWPLYSILKDNVDNIDNIPLIIDYTTTKAQHIISQLSNDIAHNNTYHLNADKRKIMHLNAVLVNNFTNHILTIAEHITQENNLPFDVLHPIIAQTFQNAITHSPSLLQTGPAI